MQCIIDYTIYEHKAVMIAKCYTIFCPVLGVVAKEIPNNYKIFYNHRINNCHNYNLVTMTNEANLSQKKSIIVSCGSFNPPTIMHLRLFELARTYLSKCGYDVLGGMMSPTHDKYQKKSLIPSQHRIRMVQLSVENYDFVKCSKWEASQEEWTRTRPVLEEYLRQIRLVVQNPETELEHFPHLPDLLRNVSHEQVTPNNFRLFFLCGADLLESFSVPGMWKREDIEAIVKNFGLIVISREGSSPEKYVEKHDILKIYKDNIHIVTEKIPNDISSTRIRDAVKRGDSIKFFVADPVIQYIEDNRLYK